MGILTDIDSSIKKSDKELYNVLYNDHVFYALIFGYSRAIPAKGKDHPYLMITDARTPIDIDFNAYQAHDKYGHNKGYIIKHWYNEEKDAYVIPSWINIKVNNPNPNKLNHIIIYVDRDSCFYKRVIFEDGLNESIKQFENCLVEIVEWN